MTEASVQSSLKIVLQGVTGFANADVVINDWTILDLPNTNSPYIVISSADTFTARQDTSTTNTIWEEQVTLFVAFSDFDTTFNAFTTARDAILTKMNTSTNRSVGTSGITIDVIRSKGPILPWYSRDIADEDLPYALPTFIYQEMIFEIEEY